MLLVVSLPHSDPPELLCKPRQGAREAPATREPRTSPCGVLFCFSLPEPVGALTLLCWRLPETVGIIALRGRAPLPCGPWVSSQLQESRGQLPPRLPRPH